MARHQRRMPRVGLEQPAATIWHLRSNPDVVTSAEAPIG